MSADYEDDVVPMTPLRRKADKELEREARVIWAAWLQRRTQKPRPRENEFYHVSEAVEVWARPAYRARGFTEEEAAHLAYELGITMAYSE